jgi:hypothetical protein
LRVFVLGLGLFGLGPDVAVFPLTTWLIPQYHKGSAPAVFARAESRDQFYGSAITLQPAQSRVDPFGGKQLVSSSQADPQVKSRDGFLKCLEAFLGLKHIGVTQPADKLAVLNARP